MKHSGDSDIYMRNGRITVPLKITSPEQFYDSFDKSGLMLSNEVASYVERCVGVSPSSSGVTIEIWCPPLSETRRDAVRRLFKIYYGRENRAKKRCFEHALLRLAVFFCLGLGLLVGAAAAAAATAFGALFAAGAVLSLGLLLCAALPCVLSAARNMFLTRRLLNSQIEFKTELC